MRKQENVKYSILCPLHNRSPSCLQPLSPSPYTLQRCHCRVALLYYCVHCIPYRSVLYGYEACLSCRPLSTPKSPAPSFIRKKIRPNPPNLGTVTLRSGTNLRSLDNNTIDDAPLEPCGVILAKHQTCLPIRRFIVCPLATAGKESRSFGNLKNSSDETVSPTRSKFLPSAGHQN